MADQVAAKKILSELSKREDLKNKVCNDCSNPNPQWASLRSIDRASDLTSTGPHSLSASQSLSAFSVPGHIEASVYTSGSPFSTVTHARNDMQFSFVRSISMDTWQDEQVRRMQASRAILSSIPPLHADSSVEMDLSDSS